MMHVSRTSGLIREQRPRKTKIGTEVAYVTLDSDTTFKVKSQLAGAYCGVLPHSLLGITFSELLRRVQILHLEGGVCWSHGNPRYRFYSTSTVQFTLLYGTTHEYCVSTILADNSQSCNTVDTVWMIVLETISFGMLCYASHCPWTLAGGGGILCHLNIVLLTEFI